MLNYKIVKIAQERTLKIAVYSLSGDTMQSRNPSSINLVFSRLRDLASVKILKIWNHHWRIICCMLPYTTLRFVELLWCNESCVPFRVELSFGELVGVNSIV